MMRTFFPSSNVRIAWTDMETARQANKENPLNPQYTERAHPERESDNYIPAVVMTNPVKTHPGRPESHPLRAAAYMSTGTPRAAMDSSEHTMFIRR